MKEFWTVLGLSIVDEPFRAEVLEKRESTEELTKLLNRDHCFHLSRFEVKELQDFMGHSKVIQCMEDMHSFWRPKWCEVSKTYDRRYVQVKPSDEAIRAIRRNATLGHEVPRTEEQEREDKALQEFLTGWDEGNGHGGHSPAPESPQDKYREKALPR
ncbi:MAG: hypothetical protein ACRD21_13530 [Vicinamibacteria bacterium]